MPVQLIGKKKYKQVIEVFVYTFIFAGPIIDILTSMSLNHSYITPGLVIRGILLVVEIFYLLALCNHKRIFNTIFILLIFCSLIFTVISNFELVKTINKEYFGFVFKYIFLCVNIIFIKSTIQNYRKKVFRLFRAPFAVIILSFLFASLTNTSLATYSWGGAEGNSGWFSSPNEIGALLCCIYPFTFINAFEEDKEKPKTLRIIDLFILISMTVIMLSIGTKAPLLGALLTLIAYFIYRLILIGKKKITISFIVVPILIALSGILWGSIPAVINTNSRISKLASNTSQDYTTHKGNSSNTTSNHTKMESIILNGRDEFQETIKEEQEKQEGGFFLSPARLVVQDGSILIVERDFHDISQIIGPLGLIIVLLLIMPRIIVGSVGVIHNLRNSSYHNMFLTLISLFMTLSAAFICGHTLLSPSVSSFFAISLAMLLNVKYSKNNKKTVVFIASAGGHLTQILKLKPLYSEYDSYIVTEKTPININVDIPVRYVLYCSRNQLVSYLYKAIINILKSTIIFSCLLPDAIVTTGAHTAIPMSLCAWLFDKKLIYIESFSKNSSSTMTGRILYPFADTFVVQWKKMKRVYPNAVYWGGIY